MFCQNFSGRSKKKKQTTSKRNRLYCVMSYESFLPTGDCSSHAVMTIDESNLLKPTDILHSLEPNQLRKINS